MNKSKILVILAIVSFSVIFLALYIPIRSSEIYKVGERLESEVENRNLSSFEYVGPKLLAKFNSIPKSNIKANFKLGDAKPPIGDRSANMRIIISDKLSRKFGMRIKYYPHMSQPQIIGFWSL